MDSHESWKIISTLKDEDIIKQITKDYDEFLNLHYPRLPWIKRRTKSKEKLFIDYLCQNQFNIKHDLIQKAINPK
jgi:hypothetical protein